MQLWRQGEFVWKIRNIDLHSVSSQLRWSSQRKSDLISRAWLSVVDFNNIITKKRLQQRQDQLNIVSTTLSFSFKTLMMFLHSNTALYNSNTDNPRKYFCIKLFKYRPVISEQRTSWANHCDQPSQLHHFLSQLHWPLISTISRTRWFKYGNSILKYCLNSRIALGSVSKLIESGLFQKTVLNIILSLISHKEQWRYFRWNNVSDVDWVQRWSHGLLHVTWWDWEIIISSVLLLQCWEIIDKMMNVEIVLT